MPLHASKAQSRSHAPNDAVDAFDFADYTAAIERAHGHLRSELARVRAGGRSAEEIEGLRLVVGKGGGVKGDGGKGKGEKEREGGAKGKAKAERESVKLGDVASVVARGRNVGVMVGEKDVRFCFCFSIIPPPPLLL